MAIRLATTNDLDVAPFFFPLEAGWVIPSLDLLRLVPGTLEEGTERLLAGEVDVALSSPLVYARHQDSLRVLPVPVQTGDINSNNVFLISKKRLDQYEKPRIALAQYNNTGEGLLKILAKPFYGFEPELRPYAGEVEALNALPGFDTDMCVVSAEVGMRAAGPANQKGYFVEDLTKAWWLLVGQPLPVGLFLVRRDWAEKQANPTPQLKQLMLFLRSSLQRAKEQMETLVEREEARTGIPAEALLRHYGAQRYEPNSAHLSGLMEFYRRAAAAQLAPPVREINFLPSLGSPAPAPSGPPRRTQPETKPRPEQRPKNAKNPARARAEAHGLQIIKGGKDKSEGAEEED